MTFILLVVTMNGAHVWAMPFRTWEECSAAMILAAPAAHQIDASHVLQCRDSGVPTMRPRARPENLKGTE